MKSAFGSRVLPASGFFLCSRIRGSLGWSFGWTTNCTGRFQVRFKFQASFLASSPEGAQQHLNLKGSIRQGGGKVQKLLCTLGVRLEILLGPAL